MVWFSRHMRIFMYDTFLQVGEMIPLDTIELDLQVARFMFIFNMMVEEFST